MHLLGNELCDTENLESTVMNIVYHLYFNEGQKILSKKPLGHKSTKRGISGRLTLWMHYKESRKSYTATKNTLIGFYLSSL